MGSSSGWVLLGEKREHRGEQLKEKGFPIVSVHVTYFSFYFGFVCEKTKVFWKRIIKRV